MIVGAAVVPAAPLMIAGCSPALPDSLEGVRIRAGAALRALPPADVTVLLASGSPAVFGGERAALEVIGYPSPSVAGAHRSQRRAADGRLTAGLAAVGRADLGVAACAAGALVTPASQAAGFPVLRGASLPLSHSVLALLLTQQGAGTPLLAVAVPPAAPFAELAALGRTLAATVAGQRLRAAVVAAGDLSAALTEGSPCYLVAGADAWDSQAVAVVDSGRLNGLERLGPERARRVRAVGWAPLACLSGILDRARLGMVVRSYAAPRGVGYLVAAGA